MDRIASPDSLEGPFRWSGQILAPNFRGSIYVDVDGSCLEEDAAISCGPMSGIWRLTRLDGAALYGTISTGPLSSWPNTFTLHARFDLIVSGGWGSFSGATGSGTLEGDFVQQTHFTDPYFPAFNGDIALALG